VSKSNNRVNAAETTATPSCCKVRRHLYGAKPKLLRTLQHINAEANGTAWEGRYGNDGMVLARAATARSHH
jgi:hypothetical protein